MNFIADHTREKHEIAGSVLTFASFNGTGDINPFPTPIPYDSRFICGRFCNYATYDAAADGPLARSVIPGQVDYEGWGASGQIEWSLRDDLQLVSITAYRKYDSLFSNEDDLSPLSHSMGGPNRLTFDSWSQELRLNGDAFGSRFHYTLGGFWMEQDIFYTSRQDLRYVPGAPLVFVSGDPVPAFTHAAFAHGAYDLTDRITFTGGIRYSEEGKDYTFRRRDRQGNLLPGQNALLDGQTGRYRGDRWDYRANVQYRLTDNVNAYAQYSTGFKGGGVNPRPFAVQQVQPFGPETLTTWEAGLKSDLFEQRVRLNVAAFTSKYQRHSAAAERLPAIQSAWHSAYCGISVRLAGERGHGGHRWHRSWRRMFGPRSRSARGSGDELHRLRIHLDRSPGRRAEQSRRRAEGNDLALHAGVEGQPRRAIHLRDRIVRLDRSPGGCRLSIEGLGHGHQLGSHADRWIHHRQRAAHVDERCREPGGRTRGHQPSGRVLLPDDVRGVRRGRGRECAAGQAEAMGGYGEEAVREWARPSFAAGSAVQRYDMRSSDEVERWSRNPP